VKEYDVAGAHVGYEVNQPPSGKALDGDSGHGRERHGVGEVQELVDRHRRELGVRAATTARVVGDAGADEGGVDALADDVDHAGGLAARDPGELGRVEHGPAALGVGEVHADGVAADADLAGRGRRIRDRRQGEHLGGTEAGDLDRAHTSA